MKYPTAFPLLTQRQKEDPFRPREEALVEYAQPVQSHLSLGFGSIESTLAKHGITRGQYRNYMETGRSAHSDKIDLVIRKYSLLFSVDADITRMIELESQYDMLTGTTADHLAEKVELLRAKLGSGNLQAYRDEADALYFVLRRNALHQPKLFSRIFFEICDVRIHLNTYFMDKVELSHPGNADVPLRYMATICHMYPSNKAFVVRYLSRKIDVLKIRGEYKALSELFEIILDQDISVKYFVYPASRSFISAVIVNFGEHYLNRYESVLDRVVKYSRDYTSTDLYLHVLEGIAAALLTRYLKTGSLVASRLLEKYSKLMFDILDSKVRNDSWNQDYILRAMLAKFEIEFWIGDKSLSSLEVEDMRSQDKRVNNPRVSSRVNKAIETISSNDRQNAANNRKFVLWLAPRRERYLKGLVPEASDYSPSSTKILSNRIFGSEADSTKPDTGVNHQTQKRQK